MVDPADFRLVIVVDGFGHVLISIMIPASLTWFGLTFHLYGLIVGLALVIWYLLFQRQARVYQVPPRVVTRAILVLLLGGLLGARLWHVMTDWQLYTANPWQMLEIWRGGLSILGVVAGGLGGLLVAGFFHQDLRRQFKFLLACLAVSLPLAQAVGRLGNYVNQELYGYPTQLPWGITIDPQFRLPQYVTAEKFHPLFGYEIVALVIIFLGLRLMSVRPFCHSHPHRLWAVYLWLYSLVRFSLDFLRPDKTTWSITGLGVNQSICLLVFVGATLWLVGQLNQDRKMVRPDRR